MTTLYPRHLILFAAFLTLTIAGCSQPVTYSQEDGISMPYPKQGDEASQALEAILNRWGDPRLSNAEINGIIKFKVLSARVLVVDNLVPRPDNTEAFLPIHAHTIISFPNGQTLETDHCDAIHGIWYQGHIRRIYITQWSPIPGGPGTSPLTDLDPGVVIATQKAIRLAHDLVAMQFALNDPVSLQALLLTLCGHDIVNTKYDFSYWQKANQIAMQYVDAAFGPPGGPKPWETNAELTNSTVPKQPFPVAQVPSTTPAFEQVTIPVTDTIIFQIPIKDDRWPKFKADLPQFKFDPAEWNAMSQQGFTHARLERHLYDVISQRYLLAQGIFRKQYQPEINELAQAAYVAKQPGATLQQRDAYAMLHAKDAPVLDQSSGALIAAKILLNSIQDDLRSQADGGM